MADELLLHARNNDTYKSRYRPIHSNYIAGSTLWQNLKKNNSSSGSAEFKNTGTLIERDLYYAIHLFDWMKERRGNGMVMILEDLYDFGPGDYGGIAGIAINAMYEAQMAGVLTPFYTYYIEPM